MPVEQYLDQSAARFPDKTAIVCGSRRVSYRDLAERANRLAHGLARAGIGRGDRVAICLENSINAAVAIFAVLRVGGVFFVVSPRSRRDRLESLVADSGASVVIDKQLFQDFERNECGGGAPVAHHGDDDLAALVYTSGSTGEPKGVMLTHRNLMAAAAAICAYLGITARDTILSALPLAFTYGLGQVTTAFREGATLVLEQSFTYPTAILDLIEREHVTGLPLVPTMATLLLQQDLARRRLPHLRYITNAAAALSVAKIRELRRAFPDASLYSMYGLTECQRVCYLPPEQLDIRPDSVGIPIPGTEAFVVDEHGNRAAPGTIGELVVRGDHVMKGYWNRPDATARMLRRSAGGDALLWTGDLFRIDDEGFLYFVERKDDIIKTRGEKVAPRQIEEIISEMPGVAEVAVYGVPDDLLGQAIAAVILPVPGAALTATDVKRHCSQRLDCFMVPAIVDIRDVLPTTATGKVSRRVLQAQVSTGAAPL